MTTEKLATIDGNALTTISGGGQSPWQQCLARWGSSSASAYRNGGGPFGSFFGGVAGCVSALASHAGSAGKPTYQRPGMPYAVESRL